MMKMGEYHDSNSKCCGAALYKLTDNESCGFSGLFDHEIVKTTNLLVCSKCGLVYFHE